MSVTRRTILKYGVIAAAGGALTSFTATTSWASSTVKLGHFTIDVLSDGHLVLPQTLMFEGLPPKQLTAILKKAGITGDQIMPPCNLTLVRDGKNTILFDVGAGPNFQSSAGKVSEAMDARGITRESVTHVVFTHAHPDHIWGLLDEFDEPLLPNASYMIGKAEWDYWINPTTINAIDANRQSFAVGAARNLKAIESNVSFFKAGEEILPGILARGTYGHTPGHMAFEVRAGTESLMIVGDAINNHHVALEKPDWLLASDQDKELGAKTRAMLLDQLASEKMQMIGYHMPFPGIGRVERQGASFRYVAA